MRVIMTGGGTGGHIYPAIAIADEIKRRDPKAHRSDPQINGLIRFKIRIPGQMYVFSGHPSAAVCHIRIVLSCCIH